MQTRPRPRTINPAIPLDLETVVLKAMEHDPAQRYRDAEELAADLRRFVEDRPVLRPPGDAERATVALEPAEPGHGHADHHGVSRHDRGSDDRLGARPAGGAYARQTARERDTARAAVLEGRQKLFEAFLSEAKANRMSRRSGQRFQTLERVAQAADLGRELNVPQERFDELRQIAVTALAMPDIVPRYLGEVPQELSRSTTSATTSRGPFSGNGDQDSMSSAP